ncbi:hypothetical protein QOZ80_9AG0675540 [Eleusine coracana subsp. coracana]|nr:hypothetical protein QOZ80_9AG0675540 [Eleusine coracana subsp. coracana]
MERRLQSKRFLLVLDDIWTCEEDEWEKLVAPFKKGGTKGNTVIVTTRVLQVAEMVTTKDCQIKLERLEDKDCLDFFQACVFDDQQPLDKHIKLYEVGWNIVKKLKGFPLAVKTVGRLLKNDLTISHWTRVLESKEWENQTSDNDIMPALRLSYNYLPFHLQYCFSHCALFPEDYEFETEELIHFWTHGFFQEDGDTYSAIHDLLHDLAINVLAYECLTIQVSNARSMQIPASVRHMSMIVEDADVQDKVTFEALKKDLYALGKRLKAANLRTLMLFGDYYGSFCKSFCDMFRDAKALRVIFNLEYIMMWRICCTIFLN